MPRRGTHYERAFEQYLQQRRIPYVAVDQAQKAVFAGARIKSFDFILYPAHRPNILADVKGRKVAGGSFLRGHGAETWTTRDDVTGLGAWEEVFGEDYLAAFIFAYWLTEKEPSPLADADPTGSGQTLQAGLFDDVFRYENRDYVFWVMELSGYRRRMKRRSAKWETVYVPRKSFREFSQPFREFIG